MGDYGGGAIALPVDEDTVAKDMLLSIRALPSGRIGVDGGVQTSCGQATIRGRTALAPDGSFTLRGDATRKADGFPLRTTFTVRGRLTADGGTGTARAAIRARARKRAPRSCRSRTVQWTVRRAAAAAAPAPAPPEATLFGLTSQEGPSARRPIVLHVTKAGRAIDRLIVSFRVRCRERRIAVTDDVNYSPEFDVAADGSFRFVERFKRTYADAIERTTIVVRGQFDQAGSVAGKLSATQRYANRRNGRRVDVCSTGTQSWSARP
ncbi:MAG: hypothetical protein KY433_00810 [Actinobacteria bacterium]|nr:hypothetical protein [Actinomycetota bacterium]